MPTLASTQTFVQGNVLNADALTNHVVDATPLATFISGQTAVTAPSPSDEFLIATAGASPARKVTFANIVSNLPTGTTAVDLTVSGATTLNGALTANGNTIIGDAATDTLTVNATSNLSNTTIGSAVVTGSWSRVGATATISKSAHGLTTGNSRYFSFSNGATPNTGNALNGTRQVTVISDSQFTVTVPDLGSGTVDSTTGNVSWYEKSLTLSSTITGPLQGDIPVNVASVDLASGDEFLIRDASNQFRLKTISSSSFFVPRAFGAIGLHSATVNTVTATGTRGSSTTVTINKSSHGIRTGDVLYMPAVAGSPAFVAGWYIATRVDDNNFTIVTVASGTASWTLTWYEHVAPNSVSGYSRGNVYSAYGNAATSGATAIQINFTNKPPSSSYCLNLTVTTGSNNQTLTMPICGVGASASTGLNAAYFKTANGFGVGVLSYAGGAAPVEADSFLNFTAIW
jgi:hypothetical protein